MSTVLGVFSCRRHFWKSNEKLSRTERPARKRCILLLPGSDGQL